MNREQMWEFLEAYRDGVIDETAAVELAHAIRGGGADAEWIIQELTFTGWIQQALQSLDQESFVRSFLERLYAERGGDEFTQAFTRRLAVETQKVKQQAIHEKRLKMPFRDLLAGRTTATASGGTVSSGPRRPGFRAAAALAVLSTLIIVIGTVYLISFARRPATAGTVIEASPGVAVLSKDTRHEVKPGVGILANQTISIPLNGHAVVSDVGNGRWRLHSGATATFMPRDVAAGHLSSPKLQGLFLQTGVLAGEVVSRGGGLCYVTTPHATAEFNDPVAFTLSVTAGSTYAEVDSGSLLITRKADGRTLELAHGHYAVAAESGEFEALEK